MNSSARPVVQKISFTVVLASVLIAILFGLIAVTANPILISVMVALLAGAVLLARPAWIVWLVLSLGLLVAGLLPVYVDALASKAVWGISLLGFFLMLIAFFKVATSPNMRKNTPAFIWVALGFLVYALLNSLIQRHSVDEFFGGFKRYFQMWGLLFALCWLVFDERDIRRWRAFVVIVALVQLPFAVYQLIALVPLREGFRNSFLPGLVPIDVVAGTFGASITGGGANAEMAAFLIIVLAFLLARLREKLITFRRLLLIAPFILAPLFLGETKAVVLLLPLMFLVLYRWALITRPHYGLMGLIVGALLTVAAGYAYLNITQKTLDDQIADTLSYNIYEKGYGLNYLNRTTVLTFWAERQGAHDPVSFVFGNGLGSSHTPTGGHVAMPYPRHGIGLTAASTLLWDMGVFGFGLFAAILALAWRTAGRLQRESTEPTVRADAAAIQAALPLFAFYLFYRLTLLETLSFQIVFAVLLGYLAWLHRRHVVSIADSR